MSEIEKSVSDIENSLKSLVSQRKKGAILKITKDIFRNSFSITKEQGYDLIGGILLEKPDFFMKKLYKKLHKQALKLLNAEERWEMEQYIIEKFSYNEGENLIEKFSGCVEENYGSYIGHIYLTNQRMILHGHQEPSSIYTPITIFLMSKGKRLSKRIKKKRQHTIQNDIKNIIRGNKPCFGFQFPIKKNYDITKEEDFISYNINLEKIKKKKFKKNELNISIVPLKKKKEDSKSFKPKREKILSIVEKTLKEN